MVGTSFRHRRHMRASAFDDDRDRDQYLSPLPSPPRQQREEDLQSLLSLRPWSEQDRARYDDGAVRGSIRRNPADARIKWSFRPPGSPRPHQQSCYPIVMAVSLGASLDVVNLLCEACPEAVVEDEATMLDGGGGRGGLDDALRAACKYRASPEVIRYLTEKRRAPPPRRSAEEEGRLGGATAIAAAARCSKVATPLHLECGASARLEVAKLLVEADPSSLFAEDALGRTPLRVLTESVGQLRPRRLPPDVDVEASQRQRRRWRWRRRTPANVNDESSIQRSQASINIDDGDGGDTLVQWMDTVTDPIRAVVFEDVSDDKKLVDAVWRFDRMNWRGGVTLVLNARPSIVHVLGVDMKLMPLVLSSFGQRCELRRMFGILRAKPELMFRTC